MKQIIRCLTEVCFEFLHWAGVILSCLQGPFLLHYAMLNSVKYEPGHYVIFPLSI